MEEYYHRRLKALVHDAREMCLIREEQDDSFCYIHTYLCILTEEDRLCLPELYWEGKLFDTPYNESFRWPLQPAPKTLCEEAYKVVFHLNRYHSLELDPFLHKCEAWFTQVLPHFLGEKAPSQPSPWKHRELDEQHVRALQATAHALEILARQLDETAGASDSAGQNTDSDASENAKPAPPTRHQKQILDILRSLGSEDTLKGSEIADRFQEQTGETLEANQVTKTIKRLQAKGYDIPNVPGAGYYLRE